MVVPMDLNFSGDLCYDISLLYTAVRKNTIRFNDDAFGWLRLAKRYGITIMPFGGQKDKYLNPGESLEILKQYSKNGDSPGK